MSSRKIKQLLKQKGITPIEVRYERGCPTPYGYANGYSLEFDDDTEDRVFSLKPELGIIETYMDFDTTEQVYDWIETLPNIGENK